MSPILNDLFSLIFPRSPKERMLESLSVEELGKLPRGEPFDNISPLFQYKHETIKELLWLLKYKKSEKATSLFAHALNEHLTSLVADTTLFEDKKEMLIAPIPPRKKRLIEYGYNPPLRVLKKVDFSAIDTRLTLAPRLFVKVRKTARQTTLSKRERRENMKGSFALRDNTRVSGKHVIVLDDVTTTGSTLKEAERVLHDASAENVTLFALAH